MVQFGKSQMDIKTLFTFSKFNFSINILLSIIQLFHENNSLSSLAQFKTYVFSFKLCFPPWATLKSLKKIFFHCYSQDCSVPFISCRFLFCKLQLADVLSISQQLTFRLFSVFFSLLNISVLFACGNQHLFKNYQLDYLNSLPLIFSVQFDHF